MSGDRRMVDGIVGGFDYIGEAADQSPYPPFLPAIETGLRDPRVLARVPQNPIGVDLANGFIPNSAGQGVVEVGKQVIGIDHVCIEMWGDQLIIRPSEKSCVDRSGRILRQGATILTKPDGSLRVGSITIEAINFWQVENLRGNRRVRQVGRLATKVMGLDRPTIYSVKDILEGYNQIAVPRRPVSIYY